MNKIAVLIAVLLCSFSFPQDGKGNFAAIGEVSIDALPEMAVITIPIKEGSELLKDAKINIEPIADSKTTDKFQLIIDMMPASLVVDAAEKPVAGSVVTSIKVSQYAAQPQKICRVVLTLTSKCDFQKELDSTKIVVSLVKSKEPEAVESKAPVKALSNEEATKKIGEQVVQSEEVDKTDQFAMQKGSMKKGDLEQIVPFISLTNADLPTFLNTIISEAGFNLVTSRSVSGSIPSIQLKSVTLKKILDLVLKQNGFAYKLEGNIIRVATPGELKAEEESAIVETRYFAINFAKAGELQGSITPFLSGSGKIQSDARTNTLIITDITTKMETFANLIESLDTKTAQVNIEAKLVDLKVESEDGILRQDLLQE